MGVRWGLEEKLNREMEKYREGTPAAGLNFGAKSSHFFDSKLSDANRPAGPRQRIWQDGGV